MADTSLDFDSHLIFLIVVRDPNIINNEDKHNASIHIQYVSNEIRSTLI